MKYSIRNVRTGELPAVGNLMVKAYSNLDGFPKESELPDYFELLRNVGVLLKNPGTEILVAVSDSDEIGGAVVFIGNMRYYGAHNNIVNEPDSCGFRLLAVDPDKSRNGIATSLVHACIAKAKERNASSVIIHTTDPMKVAWRMYERLGFERSKELDFSRSNLNVYGLRYRLNGQQ